MAADQATSTTEKAAGAASDVKDEAVGQAKSVGSDAKAGAVAVVDTAKTQARDVGGQLQGHARTLIGDASSELETQLRDRIEKAAGATKKTTSALNALAEGRVEEAGSAADWARTASEQIEKLADKAQELGPRGLADEAASFARRRPVAFLVGAAAAGFLAGRLVRNAGQQSSDSSPAPSTNGSGSAHTPELRADVDPMGSAVAPLTGATAPIGDPTIVGLDVLSVEPVRPTEPLQPERSLSELMSAMAEDLQTLVRKELELAREEVKVEASKAGTIAKLFGAAGGLAYYALFMLLFAAAWGLATVIPTGLAFLIVGLVLAAVAAVLALRGRTQMQALNPAPEQTIETLKEDAQWLSERRS